MNSSSLYSPRVIVILSLILILSGCSRAGLALINARAKLITSPERIANIRYGEESWQYLDLYMPKGEEIPSRPGLVFFYGGGWDSGQKEQYAFVAAKFTSLGYVVAIPDYIKYPQGKFPGFIKDGATAIAWIKQNIAQYQGDPDNVFVVGHSAGAHLGALLLADSSYLAELKLTPRDIRAFAGLAGPYNFTPKEPRFVRVFEPPENYPKMQVMNYIDGNEPPILLMHGDADQLVSAANQESTLTAIAAVGGVKKGIRYPDVTHVGLLLGITWPYIGKADPSTDIDLFFRQHLSGTVDLSHNLNQ